MSNPKPNRQKWRITYEFLGDSIKHDTILPVDNPPHIDEFGWLIVGTAACNGKWIRHLHMAKDGAAWFDPRQEV